MTPREALLSETFVQLADSLVDDFDVVDLLTVLTDRCGRLVDAGAVGILLVDPKGVLRVMAASTEEVRLLELFQLQNEEGPCVDCFTSGAPVVNGDVSTDERWPLFAPVVRAAGFLSVHAFPMRLRSTVIGALNLFLDDRMVVSEPDQVLAQALADVATITVLQSQAAREAAEVVAQLQFALNSRIAIEQAKGVLAERAGIDMDESFARLRRYARDHNSKLSEVAAAVVDRTLEPAGLAALLDPPPGR